MSKVIYQSSLILILTLFNKNISSQSWQEFGPGLLPLYYGVFDMHIVNEEVIWAVAFDQRTSSRIPKDHITKILRTTNGGASWSVSDVSEAIGRISFDIEAIDSSHAFITTQDYNNGQGRGLFKTEDGGKSWKEIYHDVSAGVWIRFFNENEGIIINRHHIAVTQDKGETWTPINQIDVPKFKDNEYTLLSSGSNSCEVIGDNLWFGTNKGRVVKTTDKGHTWEIYETAFDSSAVITSLAFKDSLNGICVNAASNKIEFSTTIDGGISWQKMGANPDLDIVNIEFVPGTDSTLFGTSDIFVSLPNRVSAYSIDFGKTWHELNDFIAYGAIEFLSPEYGWAARAIVNSETQPIFYKWQSLMSSLDISNHLNENILIFPNPVVNSLIVESKKGISSYILRNIEGKMVKTRNIGSSHFLIDVHEFSKGVYTLELFLDSNQRVIRKIIKTE